MVKFKVLHDITLNKEGIRPRQGDVVDLSVKRVNEVHKILEGTEFAHNLPYFERVEEDKKG
ncbi:hypothetical protein PYH66_13950 (plasmid) [Staphylococcus delphini]|uniref:hypothetical protein n=1 Tax=Staphylococcus delphini TaxID=53344 RepID=UPI003364DB7B